jgi:hypothetical protein
MFSFKLVFLCLLVAFSCNVYLQFSLELNSWCLSHVFKTVLFLYYILKLCVCVFNMCNFLNILLIITICYGSIQVIILTVIS